jgi:hypothetical protein
MFAGAREEEFTGIDRMNRIETANRPAVFSSCPSCSSL